MSFSSWPTAFGAPSRPIASQQYSMYLTYSSDDVPPLPPPRGGATPGCGLPVTPGAMTRTLTVVDFPYFDAMLNDLKNKHCVDTARVFVAGKSNGGFFVNSLACNRPNAVRALASVAGGGPQHHCTQPKPAMIVHGSADTVVSIGSGRYSRDYWLFLNQYPNSTPVPATPPPCVSYPGTLNPVLWCQHGGGHTWPTWVGPAVRGFFLSQQ